MTGIKHDGAKPRWSLLPWAALEVVVQLLDIGAQKYPDGPEGPNWQRVPGAEQRYLDALTRHVAEAQKHGVFALDPETGLPHLAAVAVNSLFLLHFWLEGKSKS
jgi:hypothetical protein